MLLCCAENGWWTFIPCNITLTSARCYNFTTPSSMGKYRIIAHFTLLIDDYSPLGGPPDPSEWFPPSGSPWDLSEWVSPWEVPQTPQNDFSNGKSEWFFHWEVPQTPQNTGGDAPLNNYTPPPPSPLTFKSTFPSYVFLPTWRFSSSSLNFLETSAKLLVVQQGCH